MEVHYKRSSDDPVDHVVVDATSLKLHGEGKWHVYNHGLEKRWRWRKLHLTVANRSHLVIITQISVDSVGDNLVLLALLTPLRRSRQGKRTRHGHNIIRATKQLRHSKSDN